MEAPNEVAIDTQRKPWGLYFALVVVALLIAYFWAGNKSQEPAYMDAANAPAENPGLTGVSDEERAAIETARTAPATQSQ